MLCGVRVCVVWGEDVCCMECGVRGCVVWGEGACCVG